MVFSSVIFVFYFLAAMLLGHALCPTLRAKNLWLLPSTPGASRGCAW